MGLVEFPVRKLFSSAGVTINGGEPWDIEVNDDRFYREVLFKGSLGLGESYLREYWRAAGLEELFFRLTSSNLEQISKRLPTQLVNSAISRLSNRQTQSRALSNAEHHYNLGNDLLNQNIQRGGWNLHGFQLTLPDRSDHPLAPELLEILLSLNGIAVQKSLPYMADWLVAGLAVARTLERLGGEGVQLKWPNDVLVNGQAVEEMAVDHEKPRWKIVEVDLAKFAGQEVTLRLEAHASDWAWEFAYWGGITLE